MPSRLTFGVEFEFALALLEAGQDDPEPQLSQPPTTLPTSSNPIYHKWSNAVTNSVFDLVTTKMAAAGLPTRSLKRDVSPNSSPGSSSGGSRDDAQDVVIDDGVGWITPRRRRPRLPSWLRPPGIEDTDDRNDDLTRVSRLKGVMPVDEFGSQWMVTEDVTVAPTRPGDYFWFPIEVQSPPYIFCDDSLQAVRLACNVITSEFRVETNATTGLHVHVGDGADGYTLSTMKKLMAFLWTFEPQIDQLHPNRRARLSEDAGETWYESLRRGSHLSGRRSVDGSHPLKVVDGLKFIYAAADLSDLDEMLRPNHKKSAYKIGHLVHGDTLKRTVEFRQHEGTLHGARVVEWIKTVVAVIGWVMDVEATALSEFLQEAASVEDRCWPDDDDDDDEAEAEAEMPPYDITDLFNDMGLVSVAAYWDQAIPPRTRIPPTRYYSRRPRRPRMPLGPAEREGSDRPDARPAQIPRDPAGAGAEKGWHLSITHESLVDAWR